MLSSLKSEKGVVVLEVALMLPLFIALLLVGLDLLSAASRKAESERVAGAASVAYLTGGSAKAYSVIRGMTAGRDISVRIAPGPAADSEIRLVTIEVMARSELLIWLGRNSFVFTRLTVPVPVIREL